MASLLAAISSVPAVVARASPLVTAAVVRAFVGATGNLAGFSRKTCIATALAGLRVALALIGAVIWAGLAGTIGPGKPELALAEHILATAVVRAVVGANTFTTGIASKAQVALAHAMVATTVVVARLWTSSKAAVRAGVFRITMTVAVLLASPKSGTVIHAGPISTRNARVFLANEVSFR